VVLLRKGRQFLTSLNRFLLLHCSKVRLLSNCFDYHLVI
jgi:hypothetical protein